jgi:hypothetical protein
MPYYTLREFPLSIQRRGPSGIKYFNFPRIQTLIHLLLRVHIGITVITGLNTVMVCVDLWSFMIQMILNCICMTSTTVREILSSTRASYEFILSESTVITLADWYHVVSAHEPNIPWVCTPLLIS